ncbi:MAG: hypothetical protein GY953_59150 [bacterium]|nr:hypothetical protein [bacterium]
MPAKQVREELARAVHKFERDKQAEFEQKGRTFLGQKGLLRQSPYDSPNTSESRRGSVPTVKSRCKWRRIEALQACKTFLREYAEARERYLATDEDVVFPHGTYWMRLHCRVAVCKPP